MAKAKRTRGKVGGRVLAVIDGLTISVALQPAKRHGRDRLWVQIRQNARSKKWRVNTCLAYARAADIQFVDMPQDGDE